MRKILYFAALFVSCAMSFAIAPQRGLAQGKLPAQSLAAGKEVVTDVHARKEFTHIFRAVNTLVDSGPFFYRGQISNKTLIRYGLWYNAVYHLKTAFVGLKSHDYLSCRIAARQVASPILNLFGKRIVPQSIDGWRYRHGFFYGGLDEFEQLGLCAVSNIRIVSANGTYIVYGKAKVSDEKAGLGEYKIVKRKVVLKKVGTGKNVHFIAVECSPAK